MCHHSAVFYYMDTCLFVVSMDQKGFRFGVFTLPFKINNDLPFVFFQKAFDSEFLSRNIKLVAASVFLLSLPFVFIVIVILILSTICSCWVYFIVLFSIIHCLLIRCALCCLNCALVYRCNLLLL